jgi:SAM-dependent methyltransferase
MMDYNNMSWNSADAFVNAIGYGLHRLDLIDLIEDGTILDVACGDGKLLAKLAENYPKSRYFGLSSEIYQARENNPNADIRDGSIQNLPFPNGTVGIITSTNIFDYAEETRETMNANGKGRRIKPSTFLLRDLVNEAHRVLRYGGLYIPIEDNIPRFFSQENWNYFNKGFDELETHSPETMKIFKKSSRARCVE